ncbi:MAG: SMP-30/gluconolactonase/LRE family protein [Candidatus Hydrogenedentes bacterium]|nr:SMP-30/gluconolactonase/LRE family protein [Candidatus Hydrogenedentota bacterium]
MLSCAIFVSLTLAVHAADAPSILAEGAAVTLVSNEFAFTEGPTVDKEGNVYFTDQPNDRICKWAPGGGIETWLHPSGRSNGLGFDGAGNLWSCADAKNELWKIAPDKTVTVVVKDFEGKLLNGPNDLWIDGMGGVYMTDPFYKREYWSRGDREQPGMAVYYLAPDGVTLARVAADFKAPNGIIGTPDGKHLYVSDLGDKKTWRYDIGEGGELNNKTLFCEMGSDGMTIDSEGNVFLTAKGVFVFNPAGEQIEHIEIDAPWTANVCFGGPDLQTLFITAGTGVYTVQTRVKGVGSQ